MPLISAVLGFSSVSNRRLKPSALMMRWWNQGVLQNQLRVSVTISERTGSPFAAVAAASPEVDAADVDAAASASAAGAALKRATRLVRMLVAESRRVCSS